MNKIKFIAVKAMCTLALLTILHTASYSSEVNTLYTEVSKTELKERIANIPSEVDLRYTEEIHGIVDTYIKRYRKGSERLLGLSEQFFPLYEAEFDKQGLPQELKYLSVVESSLKPTARSSSGAVGLWQFMRGTGELYGLRINNVVDERRDPIRSTEAASRYLRDLYAQFGDWTLALAAYNCGPGNVRKAIRRSQRSEFWTMKGYLPKETRRYIPKYVAVSYVMNYSDVHQLYPEFTSSNTLATVKVYDYTTFDKISAVTGLSKSLISEYNPAFFRKYIPKSSRGYYLTLPQEDLYFYLSQVGGFENLLDLGYDANTLKGRYMLFGAMKRKVRELVVLPVDETLSPVFVSTASQPLHKEITFEPTKASKAIRSEAKGRTYTLLPEESLADVAKREGISLGDLIQWNDIDVLSPPPPGSTIRIN